MSRDTVTGGGTLGEYYGGMGKLGIGTGIYRGGLNGLWEGRTDMGGYWG